MYFVKRTKAKSTDVDLSCFWKFGNIHITGSAEKKGYKCVGIFYESQTAKYVISCNYADIYDREGRSYIDKF